LALEVLDASENRLAGPIPSEISRLTSLVRLELSGNLFADNVVPHVLSMRSLRILDIGFEMLSGTIPTSLGFMKNLTSVTLTSSSWLSASIPSELARLEDRVLAKPLSMRHKIVWTDRVEEEVDDNDDGDP
jgi:hypothetical protein